MIDTCHGVAQALHKDRLSSADVPKFVGNQWEMIDLESEECGECMRGVRQVRVGVVGDTR
jgi:hypothetical protein